MSMSNLDLLLDLQRRKQIVYFLLCILSQNWSLYIQNQMPNFLSQTCPFHILLVQSVVSQILGCLDLEVGTTD